MWTVHEVISFVGDFISVLSICCFEVISFEVISFVCCPHAVFEVISFEVISFVCCPHAVNEVISLLDVTSTSHAYIIIVSIQSIFQMPLTTLTAQKVKIQVGK